MDDSVLTDPVEMGKIVETAVYKHVAAFYYQYATSVGYFRGGKRAKKLILWWTILIQKTSSLKLNTEKVRQLRMMMRS